MGSPLPGHPKVVQKGMGETQMDVPMEHKGLIVSVSLT